MKIEQILLSNFRIYKGENSIVFNHNNDKNISIVAGKNGYGKTTFLTSLIWAFYGGLMGQVEEKYRKDIKNAGGYEKFLKTLINKDVLQSYLSKESKNSTFQVEVHLIDVLIPSIPCKKVIIKRSYNCHTNNESLKILIDGQENELTKEVGYEVFINDFILPREIAKFFFFDAEKIVNLAEAKSKSELRALSRAYSEVLGIKKYEDLKHNLTALLTKLKRNGASKMDKSKLDSLIQKEEEYSDLIGLNEEKQSSIQEDISALRLRADSIQEKLIREGNEVTLDELKEFKSQRDNLKNQHQTIKSELKKMLEIVPIVIAGKKLKQLIEQVKTEENYRNRGINDDILKNELTKFSNELIESISDKQLIKQIESLSIKMLKKRFSNERKSNVKVLLDLEEEKSRELIALYDYIKESFTIQFKKIVQNEKDVRHNLTRVLNKIKLAEARKDNPLAIKLREDKKQLDEKVEGLLKDKEELIVEQTELNIRKSSNQKVLSEYEKNFSLISSDKKKYDVTTKLLAKLNILTTRIKEEKKYSLQKSIMLGLKRLMHKDNFISNVNVRIENEFMDIDLLDINNNIIEKDNLSKGEQQLYATALLKALVDESGINFPVFIDSPLQKFDKVHSSNVIQQFYPSISEQVVLFPLLEKELTTSEYDELLPYLNGVYLIKNDTNGSSLIRQNKESLFEKLNVKNDVLAN